MGKASRVRKAIELVSPTAPPDPPAPLLKLDFGCGPNKRQNFHGVDGTAFDGVDTVWDLRKTPWPWQDSSVGEAHASHFLEHLTAMERCRFFNELYRILIPGGTCQIITPHWASCRAYGDPTHQWPPVSEFLFYYISKDWRLGNAPHTDAKYLVGGFDCNFVATWGYALRQDLPLWNQERQQYAIANYKEVCQDTVCNLTKA